MPIVVADARALSAGQYGHLVVYGSSVIGDGGGGFYVWSPAATNADDGADWLKPNEITHPDPGRWQRVWSTPQLASTVAAGLVQLGANGDTTPGNAVQCSDTRLHAAASLAGTPNYITIEAATQVITRSLINLASHVTGNLPVAHMNGGSDASSSTFWCGNNTWAVPPGSNTVTVSGTPDYITISSQDVVRSLVDLSTDVTAQVPIANVARLSIVTNSTTTRTGVTSDERNNYVRWTSNSAKTFTINNSIASAGDAWQGFNAATTTNTNNARLTIVAGSGVTLRGILTFARRKMYIIQFETSSLADVIGGA